METGEQGVLSMIMKMVDLLHSPEVITYLLLQPALLKQ